MLPCHQLFHNKLAYAHWGMVMLIVKTFITKSIERSMHIICSTAFSTNYIISTLWISFWGSRVSRCHGSCECKLWHCVLARLQQWLQKLACCLPKLCAVTRDRLVQPSQCVHRSPCSPRCWSRKRHVLPKWHLELWRVLLGLQTTTCCHRLFQAIARYRAQFKQASFCSHSVVALLPTWCIIIFTTTNHLLDTWTSNMDIA